MDLSSDSFPASPQFRGNRTDQSTRVKSSCPYCSLEIYVSDLRLHLSSCRLYQAAQIAVQEEDEISQIPSVWIPAESSESEGVMNMSYHSSDESESHDEELTVMSRFLSPEESGDLDSPGPSPNATPSNNHQESVLCPVCFSGFCRGKKTPLLLPGCGHTICQQCVHRIYQEDAMVKCPVCRAEHYQTVSSLPVNFAILDIAESKAKTAFCPLHALEFIAFCEDHEALLCGMCAFEHKDHQSFLLDSPEAEELACRKKGELEEKEKMMKTVKQAWEQAKGTLTELAKSIEESVETHTSELEAAEERLISRITSGRASYERQLKTLLSSSGVQSAQSSCAGEMHRISHDLQTLHENKSHFDSLSIAERLKTALSYRPENYQNPPDLQGMKAISREMREKVDYQAVIQRAAMLEERLLH